MKKSNPLLAAMMSQEPEQDAAAAPGASRPAAIPPVIGAAEKPVAKRARQKHLGAYFDKRDPILERVAILRARLDMNNSELIEHALDELWKRHEAGRAFGD